MLFDLKPKERISDFFNYREELDALLGFISDRKTRMVVIRGMRRTGKSSLLRVALHKAGAKFILIDARELTSLSRKSFEARLLEELKSIKGLPASLLKKIEGVDAGVRISLKSEDGIWRALKSLKPVIAVDEAQMLRGTGVEAFFAAAYDNTDCKIILTGSEIGVLDDFLGKENPKSPLFGRSHAEIKMHPLGPDKAKEFLLAGFKEAGKKIPDETIRRALEQLDSIVGWLAIFGNNALSSEPETALRNSVAKGRMLAYSELESFLYMRMAAKKRYLALLKVLAQKDLGWADLKRSVQIELKEPISDPQFSNYLNSLASYGFIISAGGVYLIPDPLLKKSLLESANAE